jgi:hypothetical protein
MYMVWHVNKHKITFKLTNDKFQKSLSRPSIIDARAHYWAAARQLRNIGLQHVSAPLPSSHMRIHCWLHCPSHHPPRYICQCLQWAYFISSALNIWAQSFHIRNAAIIQCPFLMMAKTPNIEQIINEGRGFETR